MSNALAIAAVTTTLQAILLSGVTADPDLNDTTVTTLPLDRARGNNNANQLNLFLYQVLPNAAWRNMDMPRQVKPGETGMPPLALNLHYLMTAYGRDNDVAMPFGHHLLGKAMSVLYDHALLGSHEIKAATAASLPGSDLDRQTERVRVTLQPLALEEISKLWTGFATQYRLSAAYEVAVTLIESTQPLRTPLPVLTRGPADTGPSAQADLVPPFPAIDEVLPLNKQPSARLGDTLTVSGIHLDGNNVGILFDNPLWTDPVELPPEAGGTATQLLVKLPTQPAAWPSGFYTLAVLVRRPGESYRRATNALPFSLAPSVAIAPQVAPAGDIAFTVTVTPQVWLPEQRAVLLFGHQQILHQPPPPPPPLPVKTDTLTFQASGVVAGEYWVRLRVDGVDSLLVDRSVTPPVFDPSQKVKVT